MAGRRRKRPPMKWYGGKQRLVPLLLSLIPPHTTYVEVFGGAAALLFAKERSEVEVYNDVDEGVVNFYKVLQDKKSMEELRRLCALTPYSRQLYEEFVATWTSEEDPVTRAWKWFYVAKASFQGMFGAAWAYEATLRCVTKRWLSGIARLPEVHARLTGVQIENEHFRKTLKRYDTPETFFYCDPPYLHSTRHRGSLHYRYEMTRRDHKELLEQVIGVEGKVVLSGYDSKLYRRLDRAGWTRVKKRVAVVLARHQNIGGARQKTEIVWVNRPAQVGPLF